MYNSIRFNSQKEAKNALDSVIRHLYLLKYEVNPYVAFNKEGQLIIHDMKTHERKPIAIKMKDCEEKTVIIVGLSGTLNPYNLNLRAIIDELKKVEAKTKQAKPTKNTIKGTRKQFNKTESEKIKERIADIETNLKINISKTTNSDKKQQLRDLQILVNYISTGKIEAMPSYLSLKVGDHIECKNLSCSQHLTTGANLPSLHFS